MSDQERRDYFKFTGPARLDKALHTLEGILLGIRADDRLTAEEVLALKKWIHEHQGFKDRHPFNELFPVLARALTDDRLDEDEARDLVWLCSQLRTGNEYYDAITADIQRVHGILAGIVADEVITMDELDVLNAWMQEHEHLRGTYPYNSIEPVLLAVRQDGKIDAAEHDVLLTFLSDFMSIHGHRSVDMPQSSVKASVMGVCALDPEIVFSGRSFCVSGDSAKASKAEFRRLVVCRGANWLRDVTMALHYLVVGAQGNPCWAFAAYGRKIEKAVEYQKKGCNIVIVHENDFWDAVRSTE